MSWSGFAGIVAATAGFGLLVDAGPSDPAFATEPEPERTKCSDLGSAVARQPDGRIVVGGSTFTNEIVEEPSGAHDHVGDFAIVRYLPDGRVDTDFGRRGRVITDFRDFDAINALVLDHGILAVGATGREEAGTIGDKDLALARYRPDGKLDKRFGPGGTLTIDLGGDDRATDVAVDQQGRAIVVGRSTGERDARAVLLRLTRDGRLDPTFGDGGQRWLRFADTLHGVEIGRLGRIVVAGATTVEASAAVVVARLTAAGNLHRSFGGDGRVVTAIPRFEAASGGSLTLRAGRILATLDVTGPAGGRVAVVRHLPSGSLDTRFGEDGRALLDLPGDAPSVSATTTAKGNRAILAGAAYPSDLATGQAVLSRLTGRGALDSSFGDGGTVVESFRLEYAAYADLVAGPGGSIVAVGWDFSEGANLPRSDIALSRYTRDGELDPSFGGGGTVFTDVREGRLVCREYDHDH